MEQPRVFPTPDYPARFEQTWKTVFPPSEDTFILIDALSADVELLRTMNPASCLEIGCGSGLVSSFYPTLFEKKAPSVVLGCDINVDACAATKEVARMNSISVECICDDLAISIRSGVTFDLILFNPPYVPTDTAELLEASTKSVVRAWAGGIDGLEVIYRFFDTRMSLFSAKTLMYLVICSKNRPQVFLDELREKYGLIVEMILTRNVGIEILHVLRLRKKG